MKIRSPAVNRENLHDYLAQTGSVSLSTDSHAQRICNEFLWALRLIFCLDSSTTISGEGLVLAQSAHLKAQSVFKVTFTDCANRSQILSYSLFPTRHLSCY